MAAIDLTSGTAGAYGAGELQLQNKVQMTSTLTPVTDNLNVASPLLLSTTLVQTTSTLKITTNDNPYIDAEDGSGNNRFTIGRASSSQQVNVDFASNPTGSTTIVGAIRTYVDGVNLSEVMSFREDGNVGINTLTPGAKLDVHSASNVIAQFNRTGAGKAWTQYLLAGAAKWNTGFDNTNGNYTIYDAVNATDRMVVTNAGNVGIGTTSPLGPLDVRSTGASQIYFGYPNAGEYGSLGRDSNTGLYSLNIFQNANLAIGTNNTEAMRITNAGNVGIGTTSPTAKLDVAATASGDVTAISLSGGDQNTGSCAISFENKSIAGWTTSQVKVLNYSSSYAADLSFVTNSGSLPSDLSEKGRFTYNGYLRMAAGTGGIQFNGDTAAANALNDYEEGTWTMGVSFGGGTTGIAYSANIGTYTKIGRQVTVNGYLALANKGSSTGSAVITGLPFTIANNFANYATASLRLNVISFVNQFQGFGAVNTTTIVLEQITNAGSATAINDANFNNSSDIMVNFTYFV